MKGKTIIHGEHYSGCFVATPSFNDNTVIAHGRKAEKVRESAEKQGHSKPVIIYVPKKNTVNLY
jgi:hypothetical protein